MEIVYDEATLRRPTSPGPPRSAAEHPVLVDRFLDDAVEIDVDALYDGERALPRRRDGAHRGGRHPLRRLGLRAAADHAGRDATSPRSGGHRELAARIGVRGLLNVQYALKDGDAVRAGGQPAGRRDRAVRVQGDRGAAGQGGRPDRARRHHRAAARRGPAAGAPATAATCPPDAPIAVKEAVLPFHRFRTADGHGVDTVLGPGDEVHRRGDGLRRRRSAPRSPSPRRPPTARCRPTGTVFVSVANRDKRAAIFPVKRLADLGFRDPGHRGHRAGAAPQRGAGRGGRQVLRRAAATIVERILAGEVDLVLNTPFGSPGNSGPRLDGYEIRTAAVAAGHPVPDHGAGAAAAVQGIEALLAATSACARCRSCTPAAGAGPVTVGSSVQEEPVDASAGGPVQVPRRDAGRAAGSATTREFTVVAPGVAERFRPGQFVARRGRRSGLSMLLRRSFALYRVTPGRRVRRHRPVRRRACTAAAPSGWPRSRPGDRLDLVGPLGRPFRLPAAPTRLRAGRRRVRHRRRCSRWPSGCGPGLPGRVHPRRRAPPDRLFGELEAKRLPARSR